MEKDKGKKEENRLSDFTNAEMQVMNQKRSAKMEGPGPYSVKYIHGQF